MHAAGPVEVLVLPPAADILAPKHPWLPIGAVGDRRAVLGSPGGIGGIEPIKPLAAFDVRLQIRQVIIAGAPARASRC